MAQSSGYGAGTPPVDDLTAGVTGGSSTGATGASTGGSGTTDQAKEKASQAAGQAQQAAGQAKEQAKDQVQQAAGQAKGALRTQVDTRSTQAGEQVKTQASDIRTVGQQLREQGKEGPAKVADQAADRIERVGDYLHRADADTILDDVEQFARSKPTAVLAGGLALGFLAARALKTSSSTRYQSRQIPGAGRTTAGNGLGSTSGYGGAAGYGGASGSGGATVGGGLTGTGGTVPATGAYDAPTNRPVEPFDAPGGPGTRTPPAGGL